MPQTTIPNAASLTEPSSGDTVPFHLSAGSSGPMTLFIIGEISIPSTFTVITFIVFTAACGAMLGAARTVSHGVSADDHHEDASGNLSHRDVNVNVMHPTEQVVLYLRRNDGEAFQQELIEELGKSPASVSRYLSKMEDDDRIRRVRIDRNNLVMLVDEESFEVLERPMIT